MNELTPTASPLANPFNFHCHNIRCAVDDLGNPWFCATDVFETLDISWKGSGTSLRNLPQEWVCTLYLRGQRGSGEVVFVSEPALYRLAFRSNKPQAVEFTNWVCAEVLPAIRRHGHYGQLSPTARLAYSRQITALVARIEANRDAFVHQALVQELRDLGNAVGRTMPSPRELLGKPRQHALELQP